MVPVPGLEMEGRLYGLLFFKSKEMAEKNTVWIYLTNSLEIPQELKKIERIKPIRITISKKKYTKFKVKKLTRW